MTIWRMRVACWIPKATKTRSEYVILIAFPLQQWLQEHASVLRHTYTARIVMLSFSRHMFRQTVTSEDHCEETDV